MKKLNPSMLLTLILVLVLTSCAPAATPTPTPTRPVLPDPAASDELLAELSLDSLQAYVQALAGIQAYSGWRSAATSGEQEAVDYLASVLDSFGTLKEMGMTVEQEEFNVFMATEVWQAELRIRVDGQEHSIPVNPARAPRLDTEIAASFDSDGELGDSDPNPLLLTGQAVLIDTAESVDSLSPGEAADQVLLLDYALVDPALFGMDEAQRRATQLLEAKPLALVLVTNWSPDPEESRGTFAYAYSMFENLNDNGTPIVVARLEDLTGAGIKTLTDLQRVDEATVLVDTDVISPAVSRNLIAMIPGRDDSQVVIVGAHIDSLNGPGAMDDGSGSAILLENARRQQLMERTIAMLQIDCLTRPLDGLTGITTLDYTLDPASQVEPAYLFANLLAAEAERLGIEVSTESPEAGSDHMVFLAYGVPAADLIYYPEGGLDEYLSDHLSIHGPYDTPERAEESTEAFMEMARIALAAVIDLGEQRPELRTTPAGQGPPLDPSYMLRTLCVP